MSLRLIASDDLLSSEALAPEWIIYPLCMKGSSVMVYGRQGLGKSSAIIQLAHSLISGEPWMGFRVHKTGPVIYLQVDMAQQETRRIIERAEEAKLDMQGKLFVTGPEEGEESATFNILDAADWARLRDWCVEVDPVAVIVDTIHDSYEHQEKGVDINALIRKIHRSFKQAIGGAVLVFVNHTRKQSVPSMQKKDANEDDEDSFMGGQAWEGVVAASLHLKKERDHRIKLKIRKLRLDVWPGSEVLLEKTEHGFFEAKLNDAQMLMQWPDFLPVEEREKAVASAKTKMDVFRQIARLSGSTVSAIRVRENRNKGADYPWSWRFSESEEEREDV